MSAEGPDAPGRRVLAEVDSTNAEAARLAAAGSGPCWILAGRQTGGRGRRGRGWDSPPGNFHATLLTYPAGPPAQVALRSFAAALALHEALVALTGLPDAFALKWPNDVLLNGGKLAGILLESAGTGDRVAHLAIGIGVNLAAAPDPAHLEPGALTPVSVLGETGLRIAPEVLLDGLAAAYDRWERRLTNEGFAPLRQAWLAHAARKGETIIARTQVETMTGIFEDMDPTGALILATSSGRRAIPAADIYFS